MMNIITTNNFLSQPQAERGFEFGNSNELMDLTNSPEIFEDIEDTTSAKKRTREESSTLADSSKRSKYDFSLLPTDLWMEVTKLANCNFYYPHREFLKKISLVCKCWYSIHNEIRTSLINNGAQIADLLRNPQARDDFFKACGSKLNRIDNSEYKVSDEWLDHLTNLKEINLKYCSLQTYDGFSIITKLSGLLSLNFNNCHTVSDEELLSFASLTNLSTLNIVSD
jgi:hypothetical protein